MKGRGHKSTHNNSYGPLGIWDNKPELHRDGQETAPPDLRLGVIWRAALMPSEEAESKLGGGQGRKGQTLAFSGPETEVQACSLPFPGNASAPDCTDLSSIKTQTKQKKL